MTAKTTKRKKRWTMTLIIVNVLVLLLVVPAWIGTVEYARFRAASFLADPFGADAVRRARGMLYVSGFGWNRRDGLIVIFEIRDGLYETYAGQPWPAVTWRQAKPNEALLDGTPQPVPWLLFSDEGRSQLRSALTVEATR